MHVPHSHSHPHPHPHPHTLILHLLRRPTSVKTKRSSVKNVAKKQKILDIESFEDFPTTGTVKGRDRSLSIEVLEQFTRGGRLTRERADSLSESIRSIAPYLLEHVDTIDNIGDGEEKLNMQYRSYDLLDQATVELEPGAISPLQKSFPESQCNDTEDTHTRETSEAQVPIGQSKPLGEEKVVATSEDNEAKIGAYTKEQRRVLIANFRAKRQRRVWRKQIKYDCRKKLADTRPRVKGRFVSRDADDSPVAIEG